MISNGTRRRITPEMVDNDEFNIVLNDLSYFIVKRYGSKFIPFSSTYQVKQVMNRQYGMFPSGNMTAILGPSGSGKSTLLRMLLGESEHIIMGNIGIVHKICNRNQKRKLKVACVRQEDHLPERLTLNESLLFASKLQNPQKNIKFHYDNCRRIIGLLSLEAIGNTMLMKCSGGQRRRVSIGLELLSYPDVLILDEPTTGLDSATCSKLVQLLQKLAHATDRRQSITIVATIHQPSATVLSYFDQLYVISSMGQRIFNGSPRTLIPYLESAGIECPTYHNPADFVCELATGEYGDDKVRLLTNMVEPVFCESLIPLQDIIKSKERSIWKDLWVLTFNVWLSILRDPFMLLMRIFAPIFMSISNGLIFQDSGHGTGCLPSVHELYNINPTSMFELMEQRAIAINSNLSNIFLVALGLFYVGMTPVLLFFPREFRTIAKQYKNGWHSVATYFIGKTIAETVFMMTGVLIYQIIWYNMTGQIVEFMRYFSIFIILNVIQLFGYFQGMIISAIYSHSALVSVYVGTLSMLPFMLLSGFIVRTKRVLWFMYPITYGSYFRFAFSKQYFLLCTDSNDAKLMNWIMNSRQMTFLNGFPL
ncbi:ABC protein, sub ABCG [Blomia tropicalis]|nr:ABC protein, sub ABCG [Blomia tropicalis]